MKHPGALSSTLVNGDSENTLALGGDGVVWDRRRRNVGIVKIGSRDGRSFGSSMI